MDKVRLIDGIFKDSQEKGKDYLLYLDVDRLIAPCYEAAGRIPKKPRYGGWESMAISGHSLGHYLSALSAMYVADKDEELKKRLDYIVSELAYIQSLDKSGYVSGFKRGCFDKVFSGNFNVTRFELGDSWVPWYSIHKIYAGLIDAYTLTGNKQALDVVIKMANWAKNGTDNLNEQQFDRMLYCEHGGMCEVMANLYKITNNKDYLDLALRFYHKEIIDSLIKKHDELEGKHANTQIPKVIGAAVLYEILGKAELREASEFFWSIVTKNRSYVIGGNSRDEHFGRSGTEKLGVTTAETCNTYNMLKLTEHLYSWNHNPEYIDYYENALYNHILASQDPESGMKTYFVSTKPGHFKVYCSPDKSFWCCTGTGMENPARYIRNIYYRDEDNLFVNLFISSKIEIEDKNIIMVQETSFPGNDSTTIIFEKASGESMNLNIRVPYWVSGEVSVIVNNNEEYKKSDIGYISINRNWQANDRIDIKIPMNVHVYASKEDNNKIAFMYGPIVLAGDLGYENFPETDILEDHLKLNNYPGIVVPTIVSDERYPSKLISPIDLNKLIFETESVGQPENIKLILIPFYKLHHERYTIYWTRMTEEQYKLTDLTSLNYQEKLEEITIDLVNPNEQQSEIEHKLISNNSKSDYLSECEKGWRECVGKGEFSYEMEIDYSKEIYLCVTYWGSDGEIFIDGKTLKREFKIYVEDNLIVEEILNENKPYALFDKFYSVRKEIIENKNKIRVRFSSEAEQIAGRIFGVRIIDSKL